MNLYSSLFSEIVVNMLNINFTQPNFQKGVLKNTECEMVVDGNGTFSCIFDVVAECAPLNYEFDGKKVTKANLTFYLALNNCVYSSENGWSWDDSGDNYNIISGYEEPNVITYDGDKALNNSIDKNSYTGGLTEAQDRTLAVNVSLNIFESTHRSLLLMVIKDLLKSAPAPLDIVANAG